MSVMASSLSSPCNFTFINATPFTWEKILNDSSATAELANKFPEQLLPGIHSNIQTHSDVQSPNFANETSKGQQRRQTFSLDARLIIVVGDIFLAELPSNPESVIIYSRHDEPSDTFVDLAFAISAQANENPISISLQRDVARRSDGTAGDSILDLNWNLSSAGTPFILSDTSDSQATAPTLGTLPIDWMHQSLGLLGCQPLRHICLPGSHDAGMSVLTHSTFLSVEDNTLAQWVDIAGQLNAGIRYFDLRPVISAGQFVSGHYSKIGGSWIGGNGQALSSMVDQINDFLSVNKELVILDFSHMYNTDDGWRGLNSDEYSGLFAELQRIEHRYTATPPNGDLSALPLSVFISSSASVITIISDSLSTSVPPDSGIYPSNTLQIFNSYADTPLAPVMRDDQLGKLAAQRTSRDSAMFLLSWTLTTPLNIRDLATQAHNLLFEPGDDGLWSTIFKGKDQGAYPNIIMVDAIGSSDANDLLAGGKALTEFAVAVNNVVLQGVGCPPV